MPERRGGEGRTFEGAYLIDLFQEMISRGAAFHRVDTHGGYMEIDTREDLACAGEVVARVRAGAALALSGEKALLPWPSPRSSSTA